MKKFFIVITGPTAAGKSLFAELLAPLIDGEIINGDMGQFYQPLTIGTAKPAWKNSPIPHHLFDIVHQPYDFSVIEYRKHVIETMNLLWQRHRIPLIVGGSGFYLRSLFFPPQKLIRATNSDHAISFSDQDSSETLWKKLFEVDPDRARSIHPSDCYRIQRALLVWNEYGKAPSELKPLYHPLSPFIMLCITRERNDLYSRINQRVSAMFEEGWYEEVENLSLDWKNFLKRKKIIGYNDIIEHLESASASGKFALLEIIAQKTRNYAKRQIIFWKSLKKDIENALLYHAQYPGLAKEINLTFSPLDLYINETHNLIRHFINSLKSNDE